MRHSWGQMSRWHVQQGGWGERECVCVCVKGMWIRTRRYETRGVLGSGGAGGAWWGQRVGGRRGVRACNGTPPRLSVLPRNASWCRRSLRQGSCTLCPVPPVPHVLHVLHMLPDLVMQKFALRLLHLVPRASCRAPYRM